MGNTKTTIQSIERALQLLFLLERASEPVTIKNLSEVLGLPRTTLYPIINTLEKHQIVSRDNKMKRVELGWKLYHLGQSFVAKKLDPLIREEAKRLRAKWEQTVYSGMYARNNRVVFLLVEMPEKPYVYSPRLGFYAYAHATASGKVLLAHRPPEELSWIFEPEALPKEGPNTITDPDILMKELEKIRQQGYAIDDEESMRGLACVAAPIKNHLGEFTASISISGPKEEIMRNLEEIKADVISAALRLSRSLNLE